MSTLSEISKLIREIRDFLNNRLSQQFMDSIHRTMDNIDRILRDPQVEENIKGVLSGLNKMLRTINDKNVIGKITDVIDNVNRILSSADKDTAKRILDKIEKLLNDANQADFINKIIKALDSIGSLSGLIKLMTRLETPAIVAFYGYSALSIVSVIGKAATILSYQKRENRLLESLSHLVNTNYMQLYYQKLSLRLTAIQTKMAHEARVMEHPEIQYNDVYYSYCEENEIALRALPQIDTNAEIFLLTIENQVIATLRVFFAEEPENTAMQNYLDGVTSCDDNFLDVLNYVVSSHQVRPFISKPKRPEQPLIALNYNRLKYSYTQNQQDIDNIVIELVAKLKKNGGHALYSDIANSFEDGTKIFSECLSQAYSNNHQKNEPMFGDMQWQTHFNQLQATICNASQFIQERWQNIDWQRSNFRRSPDLSILVVKIITFRAILEFANEYAPYLCFPYNLPRDVFNGVVDIPLGLYTTVRHPINTLINLFGLLSPKGATQFFQGVYNHPARFLTSSAASYGIGCGLSKSAHSINISNHSFFYSKTITAKSGSVPATLLPKALPPKLAKVSLFSPKAVPSALASTNITGDSAIKNSPRILSKAIETEELQESSVENSSDEALTVSRQQLALNAYDELQTILQETRSFSVFSERYIDWYERAFQQNTCTYGVIK